MKKTIITLIILSFQTAAFSLETVENLDINSYMGLWHEIASIPQRFSKDCVKNTSAFYELNGDTINVTNQCTETNDEINTAEGQARINSDFNENSKLEVTFVSFFKKWIWSFGGDYWVIDLDPNYEWSVVGNPKKDALWILSRKPEMDNQTLMAIEKSIRSIGYNTCDVLISLNDESSRTERTPLCEI